MSTGETGKFSSFEAPDHERQYAVMGCLGIVRFLQHMGKSKKSFEDDVRIRQYYKSFRKLGQLLSNHDVFVNLYERDKLPKTIVQLDLLLKIMKGSGPNKLAFDYEQAIAINSGLPAEPKISKGMGRLFPIFDNEVYPYFAEQLLEQVFHPDYVSGLVINLKHDLPILGDNISHYVGEYDPKG